MPAKIGWDKQPRLLFDMSRNLDEISAAFANYAPRKTGKLQTELRKWKNYKAIRWGNKTAKGMFGGWKVTIPLPYAAIQDQGGEVPTRYPRNAQAMRWRSGGKTIFAKKARGFTLPGYDYLNKGFRSWAEGRGHDWRGMVKWR
jgi:hypothetical protein